MNTKNITDILNNLSGGETPFPVEWISEYPDKEEDALAKLSI